MLKEFDFKKKNETYLKVKRKELGEKLFYLQRICEKENVPVIIMVDGWESSGRGRVINDIVRELNTKLYDVYVLDGKNFDDYLFTRKFWEALPAKGEFSVFDRSMYHLMLNELTCKNKIEKRRIKEVENLEKILHNDHTILLKFFLHIDKKRQKKNIKKLKKDKYRDFLVSDYDIEQNENYDAYLDHFDDIIEKTNFSFAPWNIINADNKKDASKQVLGICLEYIRTRLAEIKELRLRESKFVAGDIEKNYFIEDLDLNKSISEKDYDVQIDELQKLARDMAYELYTENIPTVIAFEGIDAAGKGGAIQRLVRHMDPRGYRINPISSPTDAEKDHHYLWRFENNFPPKGKMAIFDRSWYGRVLVERVEGFANEYEWSRAYEEINRMEEELVENGYLLIKFLLVISKDEQKSRFDARQEEKPYKITDEDWRNREKWKSYLTSMNDMIKMTSTEQAPWYVISSEDKKFARIEVLKTFIDEAGKILKENRKNK